MAWKVSSQNAGASSRSVRFNLLTCAKCARRPASGRLGPAWCSGSPCPARVSDIVGDRHSEAPTATRRGSNGGETDPAVRRLCTVPGVGSVTAVAYVATIDHPHRFPHARQVAGYLGLVPRELSSGEQQRRGPITKAGNTRVRWLLVEAAWTILRTPSRRPEHD